MEEEWSDNKERWLQNACQQLEEEIERNWPLGDAEWEIIQNHVAKIFTLARRQKRVIDRIFTMLEQYEQKEKEEKQEEEKQKEMPDQEEGEKDEDLSFRHIKRMGR
ncbi:MAG: hypothetical protein ACI4AD_04795 [Roseburia sp.]